MTACPKPTPHCLTKLAIERAEQNARRATYARVTRRDGKRCRVCGKAGGDHHHILARSQGGRDTDGNLLLLCRACHDYRHAQLIRITGNAEGRVSVWWDARVSGTGAERTEDR